MLKMPYANVKSLAELEHIYHSLIFSVSTSGKSVSRGGRVKSFLDVDVMTMVTFLVPVVRLVVLLMGSVVTLTGCMGEVLSLGMGDGVVVVVVEVVGLGEVLDVVLDGVGLVLEGVMLVVVGVVLVSVVLIVVDVVLVFVVLVVVGIVLVFVVLVVVGVVLVSVVLVVVGVVLVVSVVLVECVVLVVPVNSGVDVVDRVVLVVGVVVVVVLVVEGVVDVVEGVVDVVEGVVDVVE